MNEAKFPFPSNSIGRPTFVPAGKNDFMPAQHHQQQGPGAFHILPVIKKLETRE